MNQLLLRWIFKGYKGIHVSALKLSLKNISISISANSGNETSFAFKVFFTVENKIFQDKCKYQNVDVTLATTFISLYLSSTVFATALSSIFQAYFFCNLHVSNSSSLLHKMVLL